MEMTTKTIEIQCHHQPEGMWTRRSRPFFVSAELIPAADMGRYSPDPHPLGNKLLPEISGFGGL